MGTYSDLHRQVDLVLKTGSFDPVFADDSSLENLGRMKGAYLLFLQLETDVLIRMPKGRTEPLLPGFYIYAGSAIGGGGIASRVARHFKRDKKIHWRIDQLTTRVNRISAMAIPDGNECELVDFLEASGAFKQILPGFGNVDCRICDSHLLTPVGG